MAESIWARAARNAVAGWCMGCYASNKLSVNAKNMKGEHGFITLCITLDNHFRHKYHGTFTQSPARQSSARVGRRHTLVTARVARRHTQSCSHCTRWPPTHTFLQRLVLSEPCTIAGVARPSIFLRMQHWLRAFACDATFAGKMRHFGHPFP